MAGSSVVEFSSAPMHLGFSVRVEHNSLAIVVDSQELFKIELDLPNMPQFVIPGFCVRFSSKFSLRKWAHQLFSEHADEKLPEILSVSRLSTPSLEC